MAPLAENVRFRAMKALVCAVLLICVVVIVYAPDVDLPPTVLRAAQRLILPLLIQLAALLLVVALPVQTERSALGLPSGYESLSPPLPCSSTIRVLLC